MMAPLSLASPTSSVSPSSLRSSHSLSSSSSLSALSSGSRLKRTASPSSAGAAAPLQVSCSRQCMLTNKRANNGYSVSFSNRRTKKLQHVNLQWKRIWWPEQEKFVRLKISTKAMRTLEKKSLEKMAKEAGLDLYKYIVGPREMKTRPATAAAAAPAAPAAEE